MNEQNPSEVQTRVTYYGVSGVPHGVVNGVAIDTIGGCPAYVGAPYCLSTADINAAHNTLTPVTIVISHSFTADYDSVIVQVAVTSDSVLTGNLRLRVAVLENEIIFESAPGSNGEKDYFEVMRKMLPSPAGTTTGVFAAGETKTYTFAWDMAYGYDINVFSAIAWLQNDTNKEVFQSERTEPIGGIVDGKIKVQSANIIACAEGFTPIATIVNTDDAAITAAEVRWRVGTSPWTVINWTGNLAPGASTQLTLDTMITQAGTLKAEVRAISTNNGFPTNLLDSWGTINIKTAFDPAVALPVTTAFQTVAFPPTGWSISNVEISGTLQGWKKATNAGAGSTQSARCNFYDITGGTVYMTTSKIDLSQAVGATKLTFDHAYVYFNANFFDSLRIEISNDCGTNWETIFHDGKVGLQTAPPVAGNEGWKPTLASQWVADTLDIAAYNGNPEVLIRFVGESGYGNNLYIDNVNIALTTGVKELTLNSFTLQPNPTRDVAQISFGLEKPEHIQLSVFSAEGALVQSQQLGDLTSGEHTVILNANDLPSGSYRVVLQGKEGVANTQWVVIK
jgi:hypothetical protein